MKKIILFATFIAATISTNALPTYEPFTEYAANIATNTAAGQTNSIDLCTAGLVAPSGEPWVCQFFSGTDTNGTVHKAGLDIQVTNNPSSPFTAGTLSSLLPSTFPGYPTAAMGNAITTLVVNPAQYAQSNGILGNSAALQFAPDFTRPSNGVRTLFVSYLFNDCQVGATGAGNIGRYLNFVAASNVVCGTGTSSYTNGWQAMNNTFGANTGPRYFGHGAFNPTPFSLEVDDSAVGKSALTNYTTFPYTPSLTSAAFVVGEFVFVSTNASLAGTKDTNIMWVNPSLSGFGGGSPPATPILTYTMVITMNDVGGMVLLDRPGSGQSGGVGTNFIANLMLGSTWSYVTGGPEFTSQTTSAIVGSASVSLTAAAVAAGQSVSYQWQHVVAGVTNNVGNGAGGTGGTATVTGATGTNMTLTGISSGDQAGSYQLLATSSGTGFTLASTAISLPPDPDIVVQPQPVSTNYSATVNFTATVQSIEAPLTYAWYNGSTMLVNGLQADGSTVSGAEGTTGSGTSFTLTLTLADVSYLDNGNYSLLVTNSQDNDASSVPAALTVSYDPDITSQPQPATVNYGTPATFTAIVQTVESPLTYAWYNGSTMLTNGLQADGSTVSGAEGTSAGNSLTATLTLANVSYLDDGNYTLFVTNSINSSISTTPAALAVNDPYIAVQPAMSVVVAPGGAANLSVAAYGSGISYQWYSTSTGQLSNTGDDSGVTTSNLTISGAQSNDASGYYVVVTGSSGSSDQSSNEIVYVESTQLGPFNSSNWPPTVASDGNVFYGIFDPNASSDDPSLAAPAHWLDVVSLPASAGDQTWSQVTYDGFEGTEATGTYFNFAVPPPYWQAFVNYPVIDILVEVYGNADWYNANGTGLECKWTEGQVCDVNYQLGLPGTASTPLGANNGQWNWMLLEVTNPLDANGFRVVGDSSFPSAACGAGGGDGGVNSGTLRLEGFAEGATIRAVALGPQGVFGTTNQIDRFAATVNCPALPPTNLAFVDFNKGAANNLTVLTSDNNGDPLGYTVQGGVGPAGDQRTAIQSTSYLMNFAVSNNYLGQPCNGQFSMQLCLEFYDDPNLAGTTFAPYQFATDAQGDLAYYGGSSSLGGTSASYYTMTGSGQWLKVAFFLGPACLQGVGTAPLTGGPTLYINGTPPFMDRVELGVVQNGTNALAGQTPDPDYYMNPFICDTNYGYYAEWNPSAGLTNNVNVAPGYNTAQAGPAGSQRLCEAANSSSTPGIYYLQFSLLNNVFGPVLQDNAHLSMRLTYYDDPALAGDTLEPNTYQTWVNGVSSVTESDVPVVLQGTGQWVDAYFELPNVNFSGASVCRYAATGPVYISRVRYDVIRPCGTFEGINYIQTLGLTNTSTNLSLTWFGTAALQAAPALTGLFSNVATVTNILTNIYAQPGTNAAQFFRLQYPGYPAYLNTNTP